jgi:hypothetical protein
LAYIGTKPTIGNFQICDAISVVNGQAAYTMQVGSVNVIPQSANHMIVSLNGTIQKPNSSYTVSGSTITFASNLVTNDVIDFIQILGDVLDLGVPSDATVTTAKLADDAVTAAKITDSTITAAKLASGTVQNQSAFKNIIINGDMSQAQRGTSQSSVTTTGYYTIDRWNWQADYGTVTLSQDTDVPTGQGFATSFKADVTTAGTVSSSGTVILRQKVEGQNLQYLKKGTSSAESTTLSFWIKSTKTGTYICELYDADNTRQISKAYTVSSADTWEKKELTFAGDTSGAFGNDNANSLQIHWYLSAGSDYTSGTLSTTWTSSTNANRAVGQVDAQDNTSNNFYITGVQFETGTAASDFEFLPSDVNLLRCERYFQWINRYQYQGYTVGFRANAGQGGVFYKVPLRSTGTFTLKAMQVHNHSNGANLTVTSLGRLAGSGGLVSDCIVAYTSGSATNADTGICFGSDGSSPNVGGVQIDAEL